MMTAEEGMMPGSPARRPRCTPWPARALAQSPWPPCGHRNSSITPGGWQAAVRHDTVVSRRRRRHATAASSDFFCVPFGGRASGRVSTPPTPSATTAAPAPSTLRVRRLHLRHRLRRLRPALPASTAHLRRDVQLGFRRRLQRLQPRLGVPPGPGPSTAGGPDLDRTIVTGGQETCKMYVHVLYMTETRELK